MRKNFLRERERDGKGGPVQPARAAIFCAFLTEQFRRFMTDSAAGAGDDRYFIL